MNLDRPNVGLRYAAEAISEENSFIVIKLDRNLWDHIWNLAKIKDILENVSIATAFWN
jgi:hypothetical protein